MSQSDSNPDANVSDDSKTSSVLNNETDNNEPKEKVLSNESIKSINRRRRVTISESEVRISCSPSKKRVVFDLGESVNETSDERKDIVMEVLKRDKNAILSNVVFFFLFSVNP